MIFVDTNVVMYAVGRTHPLRDEARAFFRDSLSQELRLATSAEVLQELMHAYVPVGRLETLDAALILVSECVQAVWTLEPEDVSYARQLLEDHPTLGARDLVHLASCRRRAVKELKTYDRALLAVARRVL